MIAYNSQWLNNRHVQRQAREALHEQCIDEATYTAICAQHPVGFYTPNFFVRIGLALLTLLIVIFSMGLMGLLFVRGHYSAFLVVMGLVTYTTAELFVQKKNHLNSGIDNVLIWLAGTLLWTGIASFILWEPAWYGNADYEDHSLNNTTTLSLAAFLISAYLAMRFADTLMSMAAVVSLLAFVYCCYEHTGGLVYAATPFFMMVAAGALYAVITKAAMRPTAYLYENCLRWSGALALVALYAAGNYYCVDAWGTDGLSNEPRPAHAVAMGWLFWLWTFVVPLAYILLGIRKKTIALIRTGIPLVAVAIFTFRHYHSILSAEMAMLIGGSVLFITCYSLINYLRTPHGGFTFQPETYVPDEPDLGKLITGHVVEHTGEKF